MTLSAPNGEGPLKVGFIGAGMMGGAMIRSLIRTGTCRHVNYFDVRNEACEKLQSEHQLAPLANSTEVGTASDMIVIAVEPKDVPEVCAELCAAKGAEQKIYVSLAAGVLLSSLASWLPAGAHIVRVMPNTPCTVGEMAAGYCVNAKCTPESSALVGAMLGALGSALRVEDESDLDAVTGVSGSGPAYVFQFIEALSDGGVRCGLGRDVATRLAAQTVLGAGKMVLVTGMHPGALKDMVTSPGGTTIAAVHALEQGGLRAAVMNAVVAATEKSRELGAANDAGPANGAAGNKRARNE